MTTTRVSNKKAIDLIRDRVAFTGNNFYGCVGSPDIETSYSIGLLPHEFINDLKGADFIIYSYGTAIAWFKNGEWQIPNLKYSVTTSKHQNYVRRSI
jgi:hypothetical protein